MMRFGRYLAVMAATWAIAAAAVGSFNLLVDPMSISPIRIAIAGLNERKPLRTDYDRIVNRHDVRRSQPVTIFMGSSRIKQTIDPKLATSPPFAPAYNGAMNGSADYGEIGSYLGYYLRVDKRLRYVFIEAFATALLTIPVGPTTQFGLTDDIADFASVFFSVGGLSSASDDGQTGGGYAGEFRRAARQEQYRFRSRYLARRARSLDRPTPRRRRAYAKGGGEFPAGAFLQSGHRRGNRYR
jgi:hypothetical protein